MALAFPIEINGETVTADMVRSVSRERELVDTQPGPFGLLAGEKPTHGPRMVPTGLVFVTLHLKDGRDLQTFDGE